MPGISLDFEWKRDSRGYALLPEETRENPRLILGTGSRPERIVPLGGEPIAYRPLAKHESLFRAYANVRDANTLLFFIRKFGPLTERGNDPQLGENVPLAVENAIRMKEILLAYGSGRRTEAAKALGSGIGLAKLNASLVVDPKTKMPRLQLGVSSLVHGLWLQMGLFIAGGRAVRSCLQCGGLFDVGAGTGRRLVAKFCSDAHRITYNSLARGQRT